MSRRIEQGVVQGFHRKQNRLRYEVQLDSGQQIILNERLIQPQPGHVLFPGTRLQIHLQNTSPISARVAESPFQVTVRKADPATGKLTVVGFQDRSLPLTLPVGHKIWESLQPGARLQLTPRLDGQGKQTFTIKLVRAAAAVAPPREKRPQPSTALEPQRIAWGEVVSVHPHHIVVEFEPGEQASLLRSAWPAHVTPPIVGDRVECRYLPDRYEIVEVLRLVPAASPSDSGEAGTVASEVGLDVAYFQERRRECHRHEIMAFLDAHIKEGHIEWYQMRERVEPRYDQPARPLPRPLQAAIRCAEPSLREFYLHQARALDALRRGYNVLLVTQTASGKTFCYNPAIFETISHADPSARALYIFPLNALLLDQKEKIDQLRAALRKHGHIVEAEALIGGMSREVRQEIARRNPHIIATNPEMLGVLLRGATYEWGEFFARLRYVVIDEVHSYRGLLGIHMAGLLRRLLLTVRRGRADPQFVLSSATISDPLDLAVRLTSLPESSFEVLGPEMDGSHQAVKHWAVFSPNAGANPNGFDGYLAAAALAMADLLCSTDERGRPSPLNTILFAKSMRAVNQAFNILERILSERGRPDLVRKVRKYISAELTSGEKREIYEGLRTGRYVGVVSTNALEAGIDIGKLDACIIAGFPFTVMRMRQMAGRVGRHQGGLVLFVPQPSNAVDQFYRDHPQRLLDQPPELFVLDAENPYIIRKHLNAAAYELRGLFDQEAHIFGARLSEMLRQGVADGVLSQRYGRIFGSKRNYQNSDDPWAIQNLRSNVQRPYVICAEDEQPCPNALSCFDSNASGPDRCRRRIALIDQQYAYRDCHPGAIYEDPEGKLFSIMSLDDDNMSVRVLPLADTTLDRTFVDASTSIEILGPPRASSTLPDGGKIAWGRMRVTRSFDGYFEYALIPTRRCRRCRREYDDDVQHCPTCNRPTDAFFRQSRPEYRDFPPPYNETGFKLVLDTVGAWLTLPASIEDQLRPASKCKLPGKENKVQGFVREQLDRHRVSGTVQPTDDEWMVVEEYHAAASWALLRSKVRPTDTILFPGVYGQCLLYTLRARLPEERARSLFGAVTRYPVATSPRHVCRACQTSALLPAMHTIEHTVLMRYPSVALGDQDDLGSYTTLGHAGTGSPTIFWFDNYEGGLGAAEKVFKKIDTLLEASWDTLRTCTCTTLDGCPRCTQLAHCDRANDPLSKPAAVWLIHLLLGRNLPVDYAPFIYRERKQRVFTETCERNEYSADARGAAGQAGAGQQRTAPRHDPYELLRVQRRVHEPVLQKAFEVRSAEIADDMPPVSAADLQAAYESVNRDPRPADWHYTPDMSPYEVLDLLPSASSRLVSRVYRVLARVLHPDLHPQRPQHFNQLMQRVNAAYAEIREERERNNKQVPPTEEDVW